VLLLLEITLVEELEKWKLVFGIKALGKKWTAELLRNPGWISRSKICWDVEAAFDDSSPSSLGQDFHCRISCSYFSHIQ